MVFRILFLNLFFINCFSSFVFSFETQNIATLTEALNVAKLSPERIEAKKEFFKEIFEKSRKFRKTVYVAGAASVVGAGAYCGYRYFSKSDSSKSSLDEGIAKNVTSGDAPSINKENFFDTYLKHKLNKRDYILRKDGFWGFMHHEFNKGMGVALAAALISPIFLMQSKFWGSLSDQFMQLWNGNEKERFLLIQRHLGTNVDLLHLFFNDKDILCDKSEISDNYSVFIDSVETLIAFVLVKLELAQNDQQNSSLVAIFNSQVNLISKMNNFSCEFQDVLNKSDKFFGVEQANALWEPFKQLNNQLIRFSNLCFSVFYENN